MTRSKPVGDGGGRFAWAGLAVSLFAVGCSSGGSSPNTGSTIRVQLTATPPVSGLLSVQLTAESVTRTFPLESLSPTATVFDLAVPATLTGTVEVDALVRPIAGCTGYAGTDLAYIGAAGETATVTIAMQPREICDAGVSGAAGTGGSAGTSGSAGTGGVAGTSGSSGTGGSTGGAAGTGGGAGTSGSAGTGGSAAGTGGSTAGRGGTGGAAGTGGSAAGTGGSTAGRGGTGGSAGTGGSTAGRGGTGGSAGTGGSTAGRGGAGGVAGTGGGAGTGGVAGTGAVAGTGGSVCTGTPGSIPSLSCCQQYDHALPSTGIACPNDSNNTYVYNVAFLASGNTMLTGGDDGRVKVWNFDGRTPTDRGTALPASYYGYFAVSPDGMNAAVGNAGGVDVYTTNNWTKQRTLALTTSTSTVYGVAFAPDSQRVFSIDGLDRVHVHSISNVTALSSTVATVFNGGGTVSGVLSVPPTQLATGLGVAVSGSDGDVSLYSVTGTSTFGTEVVLLATDYYNYVTTAFSPNGALLAVGDWDSFAWFWNFPVPTAVTAPIGNMISLGSTNDITDSIYGMAFSPNGQYIAITGGYNQGSVQIWNVSTRTMVSRFNLPAGLEGLSVAFSPNGSALVVGGHGCGKVFVCSY